MSKPKDKRKHRKLALEKVKILFEKADDSNKNLANDYVRKARRIAMKVNLKLPRELKRKFCKHCYAYFKIGTTCRVRTNKGKVVYSCFSCKKYTRIPYLKEKKKKYINKNRLK